MKSHILFIFIFSLSQASFSKDWMPIGGIYYDNISELNFRIGISYMVDRVETEIKNETRFKQFHHSNFLFTDYLISEKTNAYSIGWGQWIGEGNFRLGLSHINKEDISYTGLEGTFTGFFTSLKAGIYQDNITNKTKIMFGVGYGW